MPISTKSLFGEDGVVPTADAVEKATRIYAIRRVWIKGTNDSISVQYHRPLTDAEMAESEPPPETEISRDEFFRKYPPIQLVK